VISKSSTTKQQQELTGWSKILVYTFFGMFAFSMVSVLYLFVRQTQVKPPQPDLILDALLQDAGVKDQVSVAVWRFLEKDLVHNIYQNLPGEQTMETAFPMGRTEEMFVALVVGALVDREILTYEDTLVKWLPDIAEPLQAVTLEELLTHTAGIPAGTQQAAEVVRLAQDVDVATVDTYAPLNYKLITEVVNKASGKSVADWVQEVIVEPLELKHTSFQDGSFYTSMADMGEIFRALNSNQIIRMTTLVRAFLPVDNGNGARSLYGHGWEVGPFYGIRMMRIDDAEQKNVAFARFSLYGLLIAIHTDLEPEQLHAGVLAEKIARIYLEREMPQFGKPPQDWHEGLGSPVSVLVEP
jgi:CubicO group peptidase (beta-lactamase class C family)